MDNMCKCVMNIRASPAIGLTPLPISNFDGPILHDPPRLITSNNKKIS